jgi:hypothetical protein
MDTLFKEKMDSIEKGVIYQSPFAKPASVSEQCASKMDSHSVSSTEASSEPADSEIIDSDETESLDWLEVEATSKRRRRRRRRTGATQVQGYVTRIVIGETTAPPLSANEVVSLPTVDASSTVESEPSLSSMQPEELHDAKPKVLSSLQQAIRPKSFIAAASSLES